LNEVSSRELVPGTKYLVQWKQQSGNYRWYRYEALWTFVAYENKQYGPDQLIWSGRPACGTQNIDVGNFLSAVQLDRAPSVPRRVGEMPRERKDL
jgi:hypothetical protein